MGLALGPVARLIRGFYAMLNARNSWHHELLITQEAQEEMKFWLEHIERFNGQNMWPESSAVQVVY